jgi:hypothetical protein
VTLWLDSSDVESMARENLLPYSEEFDNGSWTKVRGSITADAIANPIDGQATADKYEETTDNGEHYCKDEFTGVAGVTYELSIYAKAVERSCISLRFWDGVSDSWYAGFELSDASTGYLEAGASSSIEPAGNGWYKLTLSAPFTNSSASAFVQAGVCQDKAGPSASYAGTLGSGAYFWGAQIRGVGRSNNVYVATSGAAIYGYDAQRRVSQWDSKVGSISFTQATAGNQPVRTVGSQLENFLTYSEDLGTDWTNIRSSESTDTVANPINGATDADTFIEDATAGNTHEIYQTKSTVSGENYIFSVYAKQKESRHVALRYDQSTDSFAYADLSDCSLNSQTNGTGTVTDIGSGWCKVELAFTADTTGTSYPVIDLCNPAGTRTYNGDGSSGIYIWGAQFRHADSSPAYVATTDHAIHRGSPSGRSGVWFDGTDDGMVSTATQDDLYDASSKTVFIVFRPNDVASGALQYLISQDTSQRFLLYVSDSASELKAFNYDGSSDNTGAITIANGKVYVAEVTHDGTTLTLAANGVNATSTASGATQNMTNTVGLGYYVNGGNSFFPGDILEVITADKVWPSATRAQVRRYLCRKWGADC